jgi:hypothetical protein
MRRINRRDRGVVISLEGGGSQWCWPCSCVCARLRVGSTGGSEVTSSNARARSARSSTCHSERCSSLRQSSRARGPAAYPTRSRPSSSVGYELRCRCDGIGVCVSAPLMWQCGCRDARGGCCLITDNRFMSGGANTTVTFECGKNRSAADFVSWVVSLDNFDLAASLFASWPGSRLRVAAVKRGCWLPQQGRAGVAKQCLCVLMQDTLF